MNKEHMSDIGIQYKILAVYFYFELDFNEVMCLEIILRFYKISPHDEKRPLFLEKAGDKCKK